MRSAGAVVDRDIKPSNTRDVVVPDVVELVWHEEVDRPRARRVAEILANILDNETTPGEVQR